MFLASWNGGSIDLMGITGTSLRRNQTSFCIHKYDLKRGIERCY